MIEMLQMNEKVKGKTYVKIPRITHLELRRLMIRRETESGKRQTLESLIKEGLEKFIKANP